jgi:hypothetical protein
MGIMVRPDELSSYFITVHELNKAFIQSETKVKKKNTRQYSSYSTPMLAFRSQGYEVVEAG